MLIQEHLANELLESQQRRVGALLRFDPRDAGVDDGFLYAPVRALHPSETAQSEKHALEFDTGRGMLYGFLQARLDAELSEL